MAEIKNRSRHLFRPISIHLFNQKSNTAREKVPLKQHFLRIMELRASSLCSKHKIPKMLRLTIINLRRNGRPLYLLRPQYFSYCNPLIRCQTQAFFWAICGGNEYSFNNAFRNNCSYNPMYRFTASRDWQRYRWKNNITNYQNLQHKP